MKKKICFESIYKSLRYILRSLHSTALVRSIKIIFLRVYAKPISALSLWKSHKILCVLCSGKVQLEHLLRISLRSSSENFSLQKIHLEYLFSDSSVKYIKSMSDNTFGSKIFRALAIALANFLRFDFRFFSSHACYNQ